MIEFRFEGVDAFTAALEARVAAVRAANFAAITKGAEAVRDQARENAHTGEHSRREGHIPGTGPGPNVVTQNLIDNIIATPAVGGLDHAEAEAGVAGGGFYGEYLEAGRGRYGPITPYPFFAPATRTKMPEAARIVTAAWRRALNG